MADRRGDLPADVGGAMGSSDLDGRLDRWVAAARSDEAAATRSRQRWLEQAAAESATFIGVVVDLAERGATVVVHGVGGRRRRGVVVGVGTDFLALGSDRQPEVLLAFRAIASVQTDGSGAVVGDREVRVDTGLLEAVAALAEERPRVRVSTIADPEGVAGELRSVGRDVLTLRLDGEGGRLAYVPVATVAEVYPA